MVLWTLRVIWRSHDSLAKSPRGLASRKDRSDEGQSKPELSYSAIAFTIVVLASIHLAASCEQCHYNSVRLLIRLLML